MSNLPATIPCPRCEGSGELPNPARTGQDLRLLRKRAGVGLRELGRELGLSAGYLHDLEGGRRAWNLALVSRYRLAIGALTARTKEAELPSDLVKRIRDL